MSSIKSTMRTIEEIIQVVSCNGSRELTPDRIEQIVKEFDDQQWIDTKIQLPECGDKDALEVIASYLGLTDGARYSISAAFYKGKFYILSCWSEDGIAADQIDATHWRALPEKIK